MSNPDNALWFTLQYLSYMNIEKLVGLLLQVAVGSQPKPADEVGGLPSSAPSMGLFGPQMHGKSDSSGAAS